MVGWTLMESSLARVRYLIVILLIYDTTYKYLGIALIYPDMKTAIVGKYKCGQLVTGAWSRVKTITDHCGHSGKQDDGLLVPAFETMSNTIFK